ncbi:hypothetical protein ABQE48_14755 [Mycolicibacterium thermoresistibile]
MSEELRVDTELVRAAGGRIKELAEAIPAPPEVSPPVGEDALTAAISARISEVVDPVIEALPVTKEELRQFAVNVVSAADMYDVADRQIAAEILKRLGVFGEVPAHGGAVPSGRGQGASGVLPSVGVGSAVGGVAGVSGGAAGGAGGQAGGFEQMMGMPLQLAQQAAQVPVQVAGMVGQVPQQLARGAQGAMERVVEFSELKDGALQEQGDSGEFVDRAELGSEPAEPESAAGEVVQGGGRGERAPVGVPSGPRGAGSGSEVVW